MNGCHTPWSAESNSMDDPSEKINSPVNVLPQRPSSGALAMYRLTRIQGF